ncbi:hypothetical protein BD414DRAFT_527159, partial [Trametes punicea]
VNAQSWRSIRWGGGAGEPHRCPLLVYIPPALAVAPLSPSPLAIHDLTLSLLRRHNDAFTLLRPRRPCREPWPSCTDRRRRRRGERSHLGRRRRRPACLPLLVRNSNKRGGSHFHTAHVCRWVVQGPLSGYHYRHRRGPPSLQPPHRGPGRRLVRGLAPEPCYKLGWHALEHAHTRGWRGRLDPHRRGLGERLSWEGRVHWHPREPRRRKGRGRGDAGGLGGGHEHRDLGYSTRDACRCARRAPTATSSSFHFAV